MFLQTCSCGLKNSSILLIFFHLWISLHGFRARLLFHWFHFLPVLMKAPPPPIHPSRLQEGRPSAQSKQNSTPCRSTCTLCIIQRIVILGKKIKHKKCCKRLTSSGLIRLYLHTYKNDQQEPLDCVFICSLHAINAKIHHLALIGPPLKVKTFSCFYLCRVVSHVTFSFQTTEVWQNTFLSAWWCVVTGVVIFKFNSNDPFYFDFIMSILNHI